MIAFILAAVLALSPEPTPIHESESLTFRKLDATGKPLCWDSRPKRVTKFWRDSGLLWCDDPSCIWCRERVYGFERGSDYPIRK